MKFPIKVLLIASAPVLVSSCGGPDADANFLPPPPPALEADQSSDPRPSITEPQFDGALDGSSEDAYEDFVSAVFQWGDRRNLVAWRWCNLWNKFASEAVNCGPEPIVPDVSE